MYVQEIRPEELTAISLRREAEECAARGEPTSAWRVRLAASPEAVEILVVPDAGRAGVAGGGDDDWYDAVDWASALRAWVMDGAEDEPTVRDGEHVPPDPVRDEILSELQYWRPAADQRKADAVRDQLAQALDLLRREGAS